ncbi:transposase, partial [Streptomyces sp. NRRL WC-3549]|uniref:transposase n=1 Tax=Streptomyces sp. NRRL WC-3549 TaxID=1463925 RepID=UPI003B640ADD
VGPAAHRSRKVRDWLAAHPDDVELHFLPPHSPELNPDELVNTDLKHSLPEQHPGPEPGRTRRRNLPLVPQTPATAHIVRGYFGGPHVRYVLDENRMSF